MSRSYSVLDKDFRAKIEKVDTLCYEAGYEFRPFFTLRTPQEQARLWRQSRSSDQIRREIQNHRDMNCHFLADCIEKVGPQHGRWATNALPGRSWHQWGLAVDSFLLDDGNANWSNDEAYKVRAEIARSHGLTAGYFWKPSQDKVHIQAYGTSVTNLYTVQEIDTIMKERFGDVGWQR